MGITTAGLNEVVKLLVGSSAVNAWDYLALGDDNTAFAVGQTALVSEIVGNGLERAQDATPTTSGAVASVDYTWTATGAETLREIALLNAAAAGVMFMRSVMDTARVMTTGATYTGTVEVTSAAA